jgi:LuxR family maltose regulon positive regulatory protein
MCVENGNTAGLYFPSRLRKRLAMISDYSVTLVEAPSGFGKTTAVREYIKDRLQKGVRERWYTCLGEPPLKAWEGIWQLFEVIGGNVAERLKEAFPPTIETLCDIAAIIRDCRCETETFLVIDNYHLFENEIHSGFVYALSAHWSEKLHIIIITQPHPTHKENANNANILRLETRDFYFDLDSTAHFCRWAGIKFSSEELDYIHGLCGGWISALRLITDNYIETGSFVQSGLMDKMIETALLNRLSDENRNFLIILSLLDSFTEKQAAIMGKWDVMPEDKLRLLEGNFFIPYISNKGVYSMHNVLRAALTKRFERQSAVFIAKMNHRAGEACMAEADYLGAARFFLAAEDYDSVLSIPFTPFYMSEVKEQNVLGIIELVIEKCDESTLLKYPFTLLRSAYQFIQSGKMKEFEKTLLLLRRFLKKPPALPYGALCQDALSQIRGEVATLMSFIAYNDIKRMSYHHREALSYLNEKSSVSRTIVFGTTPWTFGVTSVLYMFWSRVGELDKTCALMDECLPYYLRLSGGHGAGADSILRAEVNLTRGDDAAAESLSHKAIYFAQEENQQSICLCAELILGRIAILRGDEKMFSCRLENIQKLAKDAEMPGRAMKRMAELCIASLNLAVGRTDDFPEWLRDKESIRKVLLVQGHSYGFMLYGDYLLQKKSYSALYAFTDIVMSLASRMNYLLPQVYHQIYLSMGKVRESSLSDAMVHLANALSVALPDRIYLPFAEAGPDLFPLLEAAKVDFKQHVNRISEIITLVKRQSFGASKITTVLNSAKLVLTTREREIALLAKERLKTGEIALRLFISENTVKTVLKKIHAKLGIHSKEELKWKDF